MFGYSAAEVVGKPVTILNSVGPAGEEARLIERIRRGERVDHYETIRRRKDGGLVDISLTVSPIKDAEGRIVGASKIARDISDRKRKEELLDLLAREVDHRSKNLLALVQATVRLTATPRPSRSTRPPSRGVYRPFQMHIPCWRNRGGKAPIFTA